jgi:S-adenosylmethionine hydrolase
MKAVILRIYPQARIIDVSHGIQKFNVRMGAFVLSSAVPYFPDGTVHVAIVDPEVGGNRRPIVVRTKHGFLVGPDNGVLMMAAEAQGILCIREIANPQFTLPAISHTFHGRDIFAPVAAHLAKGAAYEKLGPEIADVVKPTFAAPRKVGDSLLGEVVHVDDFGNIITNIREEEIVKLKLKGEAKIKVDSSFLKLKLCRTYADVERSQFLSLIGSHGYFEVAMNQGNAAKELGVRAGDKVRVSCT